uniref:Uncharacterized protein n=1 Tax=Nothobranchius furzeri TaxID=105023 RepID=A0A8C6NWR4_NOTFU
MSAAEANPGSLGRQVIYAVERVVGESTLREHQYEEGLGGRSTDDLLELHETTVGRVPTSGKALGAKERTTVLVDFSVLLSHLWEKEVGIRDTILNQLMVAEADKDMALRAKTQIAQERDMVVKENFELHREANELRAEVANLKKEMALMKARQAGPSALKDERPSTSQTSPPHPTHHVVDAAPPAGGSASDGVGRSQGHHPVPPSPYGPPPPDMYRGYPQPDIYRMSRSVKKFSPKPDTSYPVDAYLSDLRHHFRRCPGMSMEDRIFVIRLSSDGVGSLIDRKRNDIGDDYEKLEQVVRQEYTYNTQRPGLQLALSVKQGRAEDPQVYYQRLFNAYIGTECKDGMEEDKGFKALFLENQHVHYSSYMGTVDSDTTPMRELRRMASCAFVRFGKTGKGSNNPISYGVRRPRRAATRGC